MTYQRVFLLYILAIGLAGCGSAGTSDKAQPAEPKSVVASGGAIHLKPEQAQASGLESAETVEQNVAPVVVVVARVRTRAGGESQVFSPFPGRLVGESPLPRLGEFVNKGQHIADVEQLFMASEKLQFATTAIQLQAKIQQAQQEVELKRTESDRAQQLYDGGAIALKQLQTAQFDLRQAEARLAGAQRSKEQYDAAQSAVNSQPRLAPILAPISGTIVAADVAIGQQVEPAKSLLTVADLSTVWVEAAVHERDLAQVRGARVAEIVIPASAERPFRGKLVTTGNLVDPQNRTVPVIFSVENRGAVLKVEMFVEAHIPVGPPAKALLIPSTAVVSEQGAYSVYVETEPGVYRRKIVQLGQHKDGMVVVTAGLGKGERVVSVGAQTLRSESLKGEIPAEEEEKKKR